MRKIRQQGLMDPCLGHIHLVQMQDVTPETGVVHMNTERYDGDPRSRVYWELKPIQGLVWSAGWDYPQEGGLPGENPQLSEIRTLPSGPRFVCGICHDEFADDAELADHVAYEHTTVRYDRDWFWEHSGPARGFNTGNPEIRRDLLILAGVCRTDAEVQVGIHKDPG